MKRDRLRNAVVAIALAALSTVICSLPGLDSLDHWDSDLALWGRARLMPLADLSGAEKVAVIALDEASYGDPELAGLPRVLWTPAMAEMQDAVLGAGALALGWDVILPTTAASWVADKQYDRPLLQSLARHGRAGRIVLGQASVGSGTLSPHAGLVWAAGGPANLRSLNLLTDPDGVVRALPTALEGRDGNGQAAWLPSMAFELARRSGLPPEALPARDGQIRVNFPDDPGDIAVHSFADILACARSGRTDYLARAFAGRTVLFGLVLDVEDRKLSSNRLIAPADFAGAPAGCMQPAPRVSQSRSTIPGVMIHAAGLANLLGGSAITIPSEPWRLAQTAALALLVAAVTITSRPVRAAPVALVLAALWFLVAVVALRQGQLVLPILDPVLASGLALSGGLGYRFMTADRERARVRATFSRYLDVKVVDAMLERGDIPALGGERRELTCIFTDLAGFSGISEALGPVRLVEFLNRYFAVIGAVVERHGGIVERFLGDAICAVFGAPIPDKDHAFSAVCTALEIQKALAEADLGLPDGMQANTRIGINSGDMVVGNIGSARRYTYTVMGDATNLAARLESGCKQFGTMVLMGDRTAELVEGRITSRVIDRVRVVGRDAPVTLREPLGLAGQALPAVLQTRREAYEAAFNRQQSRDFSGAAEAFRRLAESGDPAAVKALERVERYRAAPPPEGWDGVTDLNSK